MSKNRLFTCSAVIAALIWTSSYSAFAQAPLGDEVQSPFAESGAEAAPAATQAEGAAKAAARAAAEKSVLAAEQAEDHAPLRSEFCRCVDEGSIVAVARIEHSLREPLHSQGLDYAETPLQDVISSLQDEYGIPMQIDSPALEAAGIGTDSPVTINIHNTSLRSALRLMLRSSNLTWVVRDEVLMITTPEEAEAHLSTCVYDVRAFMDDADITDTMDSLIDTIVSCVATDTWAENGGGEAEIRPLQPGLLVISQTQAVHHDINGLLSAIRDMGGSKADGDAAGSARHAKSDDVVTRSYVLRINQGQEPEKLRAQVRELIVKSMPDEQWDGRLDSGQPVMLSMLPDRVVLRHTPAIQRRVERLLCESGIAVPSAVRSQAFQPRNSSGGGGVDGDGKEAGGLGGGAGGGGFGGGGANIAKPVGAQN